MISDSLIESTHQENRIDRGDIRRTRISLVASFVLWDLGLNRACLRPETRHLKSKTRCELHSKCIIDNRRITMEIYQYGEGGVGRLRCGDIDLRRGIGTVKY